MQRPDYTSSGREEELLDVAVACVVGTKEHAAIRISATAPLHLTSCDCNRIRKNERHKEDNVDAQPTSSEADTFGISTLGTE